MLFERSVLKEMVYPARKIPNIRKKYELIIIEVVFMK
jgi:hypothetical protein